MDTRPPFPNYTCRHSSMPPCGPPSSVPQTFDTHLRCCPRSPQRSRTCRMEREERTGSRTPSTRSSRRRHRCIRPWSTLPRKWTGVARRPIFRISSRAHSRCILHWIKEGDPPAHNGGVRTKRLGACITLCKAPILRPSHALLPLRSCRPGVVAGMTFPGASDGADLAAVRSASSPGGYVACTGGCAWWRRWSASSWSASPSWCLSPSSIPHKVLARQSRSSHFSGCRARSAFNWFSSPLLLHAVRVDSGPSALPY